MGAARDMPSDPEAVLRQATGRSSMAEAVAWLAEGHPLLNGVEPIEALQALEQVSGNGAGPTAEARRRLAKDAASSELDTARELFALDKLAPLTTYRRSLDRLAQSCPEGSLANISASAVKLAQQGDPNTIQVLCLAYRALLELIFTEARRVLRPDGHLIFSYANREPEAWIDVLSALRSSDFRACGYTIVHSENETDYAKRGVRACTLDLILDLVPAGEMGIALYRPGGMALTAEEAFLRIVGETLLRLTDLDEVWEESFARSLRESPFIAAAALSAG